MGGAEEEAGVDVDHRPDPLRPRAPGARRHPGQGGGGHAREQGGDPDKGGEGAGPGGDQREEGGGAVGREEEERHHQGGRGQRVLWEDRLDTWPSYNVLEKKLSLAVLDVILNCPYL